MIAFLHPDILQIRSPLVNFHALRSREGIYLIDSGFVAGVAQLHRALNAADWNRESIRGILLTHGHLDHIANVRALVSETGAWVAAPAADARHFEGVFPYQGASRVCGALEFLGSRLLHPWPVPVDRWLSDLEEIPVWDGLITVHLPGHTDGHSGFHCPSRRILFSADLFSSHFGCARLPPAIFNCRTSLIPASLARACSLDLAEVFPNHGDRSPGSVHLSRMRTLHKRIAQ